MLTMNITVETTVSELLTSLGLADIPHGCELKMADVVEVRAQADSNDIITHVDCGGLTDHIDQTAVMELASAISRGDLAEAKQLMERIFGAELSLWEWVQQGGFSHRARAA